MFSYWRIDILSGAGDNTNEDSDVWLKNIKLFQLKLINLLFICLDKAYLTKVIN